MTFFPACVGCSQELQAALANAETAYAERLQTQLLALVA